MKFSKKLPQNGLLGKLIRLGRYMTSLRVSLYASHASFFLVLAIFPMLVLFLCLLRYTGFQVESFLKLLDGVIPAALMPAAKRLIINTYQNNTGKILSLSALTALWSASYGFYGLCNGLNAVYRVRENRGYVHNFLLCILYTFAFLMVLLLTLVLQVFGKSLLQLLHLTEVLPLESLSNMHFLRFFVLLAVQTLLFTAMFTVLPNRRNRFISSLPGAGLAAAGWLIFSEVYSAYVENFTRYTTIFGSVYAVALSLLWIYCCISILFYGGALNHWLAQRKHRGQAERA